MQSNIVWCRVMFLSLEILFWFMLDLSMNLFIVSLRNVPEFALLRGIK